jgi:hypothetical protein
VGGSQVEQRLGLVDVGAGGLILCRCAGFRAILAAGLHTGIGTGVTGGLGLLARWLLGIGWDVEQ